MYKQLWTDIHRSVCCISFLVNGERVGSGSGFRLSTRIVTNNHVIQVPPATQVVIHFVGDDGYTVVAQKTLSMKDFQQRLIEGDPKDAWDYTILDMDIDEFAEIPSLTMRRNADVEIGSDIAVLGFQFDQSNLSLHTGVLSSKFVKAGVNYLQLD